MNAVIGTQREFVSSDKVRLVYHENFPGGQRDPNAPNVVLIHGWSGACETHLSFQTVVIESLVLPD